MQFKHDPIIEIFRRGNIQIPAILYTYADEMDLDAADLGIIGAIFGAYQQSQPFLTLGIEVGQLLKLYPGLKKAALSKRLSKWEQQGLIEIENGTRDFSYRKIHVDPLIFKLKELIIRDNPILQQQQTVKSINDNKPYLLFDTNEVKNTGGTNNLKFIADFIAQKTANPVNVKMANEIRKWLNEYGFSTQVILCMLELCFERNITNLNDIQNIASGLKERSITNLHDIEAYFKGNVDKPSIPSNHEFYEFESFSGINMSAQARKAVYNKWRYEWGFQKELILYAAELMCLQTRNASMNYIESLLQDWKNQGITTIEQVKEYQASWKAPKERQNKNVRQTKEKGSKSLEDPKHEKFFKTKLV